MYLKTVIYIYTYIWFISGSKIEGSFHNTQVSGSVAHTGSSGASKQFQSDKSRESFLTRGNLGHAVHKRATNALSTLQVDPANVIYAQNSAASPANSPDELAIQQVEDDNEVDPDEKHW